MPASLVLLGGLCLPTTDANGNTVGAVIHSLCVAGRTGDWPPPAGHEDEDLATYQIYHCDVKSSVSRHMSLRCVCVTTD